MCKCSIKRSSAIEQSCLKKGSKNTTCNTQILGTVIQYPHQDYTATIRQAPKDEAMLVEDGDFWENAEGERPD
jgi:hypothetical protein